MTSSRRTIARAAGVVLAGATVWAGQNPPPAWELWLTERFNRLPAAGAWALYPVMQLGAGAAPLPVSGLVLAKGRNPRQAAVVAVAGLGSWFAAKALKPAVGRARPAEYLPRLDVREGDGSGLGFPSGHSAVAAAVATTIAAVWAEGRLIVLTATGLVGLARIVFGMHLPVDVVGGWALGVVLGTAVLAADERL